MLKSDGARFLWKIDFCPNLGKEDLKNWKFCNLFFLKVPQNDFPLQSPCLAEFLFWLVRLQDSLKCNNICKKIELSSWFFVCK